MESFFVGLASAGAFVLLAPLVLRLQATSHPVFVLLGSALIVHLAGLCIAAGFFSGPHIAYWRSAPAFWFCFGAFMFGYGALYSSMSLRILIFIAARNDQTTNFDTIHREVIEREFAKRRDELVQSRLSIRVGDHYRLTEAGRVAARRFRVLQAYAGLTSAGLYNM